MKTKKDNAEWPKKGPDGYLRFENGTERLKVNINRIHKAYFEYSCPTCNHIHGANSERDLVPDYVFCNHRFHYLYVINNGVRSGYIENLNEFEHLSIANKTLYSLKEVEAKQIELLAPFIAEYQKSGKAYTEIHIGEIKF